MSREIKILIIRFSSIGDIVLTTTVIRCLKQQYKGVVSIDYITKENYAPILTANPYISKVYSFNNKLSEVIPELKKNKYDYIIDLQNNLRSLKLKSRISREKHSFHKLNIEKWKAVNLKQYELPDIHIVDRYLDTVESLGVSNDGKGLDYFIPKDEEIALSDLPKNFSGGYIAFVIGAAHTTKCLPIDKIIDICRKTELPLVLLGGKDEQRAAKFIEDKLDQKIFNSCGKYSIHQSASIIRQAEVVVTHDTGMMHIAAAFKKKIVSVWGNTIPEFGMYPYLPSDLRHNSKIIEIKDLKCRPCSKIGFDKCPKGHFKCMKLIQNDDVVEAIFELQQRK